MKLLNRQFRATSEKSGIDTSIGIEAVSVDTIIGYRVSMWNADNGDINENTEFKTRKEAIRYFNKLVREFEKLGY